MTDQVTTIEAGENSQIADSSSAVAELLYADSIKAAEGTQDSTTQQQTVREGEASDQAQGKPDAAQAAPEKYEFVAPEGTQLDPGLVSAYEKFAKGLNLPQEKAQELINEIVPLMAKQQSEGVRNLNTSWVEQSSKDPEFGGEKLQENLAVAKKAIDKFATPEFMNLLKASSLGNNPEMIRMFYRMGKAMSEDRVVTGRATQTRHETLADRLYAKNH
jgi:hypothetical protein